MWVFSLRIKCGSVWQYKTLVLTTWPPLADLFVQESC